VKIDIDNIDRENFLVHPHLIAGEICYLVQPNHIGCKWNKNNLIFRSSVWNKDGEPVSLSFKKFFNWEEQPDLAYKPFSLTANGGCNLLEKIDGSTLIVSRYKGKTIARTRGTVDATKLDNGYEIELLKLKYPKVFAFDIDTNDHSYIYEWVSPTNKIVLNYGDEPDLYLTAIIRHEDYEMLSQVAVDGYAKVVGVKRPKVFKFDDISGMLAAVEQLKGQEGLCVYCNYDQDIRKVKSAWYLALHRMKAEIGSFERVVDIYFTQPNYQTLSYNEVYDFFAKTFDFEIAEQCRGDISRIIDGMKEVAEIILSMLRFVGGVKMFSLRKQQAEKILQAYGNTNRAGMAFKLLDNKPLDTDDVKKLLYQVLKK
jgi:hypothetical protein